LVTGSVDTDPVRTPDSAASCICPTGFVLFEGECIACPDGTECSRPGISVDTLPVEPGHWRSTNASVEVLQCDEDEACINNGTDVCAVGHRGPLCELCLPDYAASQGVCVSCDSSGAKSAGAFAVVGVIVVIIGIMLLGVYSFNKDRVKKLKEGSFQAAKDLLGVPIKLVIQYVQIVSMMEVSLDIKFPKTMKSTATSFSLANVEFMSLAPVGCVGLGMDHDSKLLLYTGVLMGIGVVVGLLRKRDGVVQA
jgi:hypothetical protein